MARKFQFCLHEIWLQVKILHSKEELECIILEGVRDKTWIGFFRKNQDIY